jgi:hypothetical protein
MRSRCWRSRLRRMSQWRRRSNRHRAIRCLHFLKQGSGSILRPRAIRGGRFGPFEALVARNLGGGTRKTGKEFQRLKKSLTVIDRATYKGDRRRFSKR